MATLRIECVDSATGNPSASVIHTVGGITIPSDAFSRAEDVEYDSLINRPSGSHLGAKPYFTFQNLNLSFLDGEQINGITLNIRQGIVVKSDRVSFASLSRRLGENQTTGARALRDGILDFNYANNASEGEWLEISVPNLATLKRLTAYGLYMGNPGSASAEPYSAFYGKRSPTPPYIVVDYVDSKAPPTVRPISPQYSVVDSAKPITFTWSYYQPANQPQSHFDLQYYSDGWVTIQNKTASAAKSYTAPAGTLPESIVGGETQWRIRAWMKNGTVPSVWSDPAPFVVRSSPSMPNITDITTGPRPTFAWQAGQQSGYDIEVLDDNRNVVHATGERFGVDRSWNYPGYLPDASYIFRIRVINSFSQWSQWAEAGFSVANIPPGAIAAQANDTGQYTIAIIWETETEFSTFYILRNGEPIAKLEGDARYYEDTTAHGKNTYVIRGIIDGYYSDSNADADTVRVKTASVALLGTKDWVKLVVRRGERPSHNITREALVSYRSYEGARLPVARRGKQRNIVHIVNFTFCDPKDYDALIALENRTVIYKDCMGQRIIGNLTIPSSTLLSGSRPIYDFEINITETNVREAIAYD